MGLYLNTIQQFIDHGIHLFPISTEWKTKKLPVIKLHNITGTSYSSYDVMQSLLVDFSFDFNEWMYAHRNINEHI